jgi:GTP diphosphokinase / guanosine-3',5'-bis(diphosphate) 3'-diphosphatase
MTDIDSLARQLGKYLDATKIELVYQAYYYAEQAHSGQTRSSGDPYITHPLAVANILSTMHMDHHSIMAAILHDVIEDTDTSKATLSQQFGETVANLVDGVSKLAHIEFDSQEEKQAKNFEKMVMAMAKDIRVIVVKLADRLHNMRTLGPLKAEKRQRIARETLDIYARIAGRLGMEDMRVEFEDRGFATLYPLRARRLKAAIATVRSKQKELVEHTKASIEKQLERWNIDAKVIGREKHLYSIYRKMEGKKKFRDITDVFAFRIIVDDVDTCYRVLGAVHTLYKPLISCLKDYIAIPKANGYQSLHTVLNGVQNIPIEVQIRTHKMDDIATSGIAAHWLYKSEDEPSGSHARARRWINNLLELQKNAGSSLEFIEHVKNDFFSDEVYVFTPEGEIIELPADATAVDFAYAVHTDVGNCCVGCRINNQFASLSQPLENGQQVHIITNGNAQPKAMWLNTVVTSKARSAIRHYLKHYHHQDAIALGERMLDRTLEQINMSTSTLSKLQTEKVLQNLHLNSMEQLLTEIGLGKRMSNTVAKLLAPEKAEELSTHVESPLTIDSINGTMITLSRCCRPIPNDPIIGHISAGKGLVIHLDTCKNMVEIRQNPEKISEVSWSPNVSGEFPVDILVNVESDRGIIAELASHITLMEATIDKIQYEEKNPLRSNIKLTITVKDRLHLANIMRRLRRIRSVEKIFRDKN